MYSHFKETKYTKKKNCFNEIYLEKERKKPRYDPTGSVVISIISNYRQLTLTNQRRAFMNQVVESFITEERINDIKTYQRKETI